MKPLRPLLRKEYVFHISWKPVGLECGPKHLAFLKTLVQFSALHKTRVVAHIHTPCIRDMETEGSEVPSHPQLGKFKVILGCVRPCL